MPRQKKITVTPRQTPRQQSEKKKTLKPVAITSVEPDHHDPLADAIDIANAGMKVLTKQLSPTEKAIEVIDAIPEKVKASKNRGFQAATVSNISRLKAQIEGDLPHEFLLKVMRGDPIRHTRVQNNIDPKTGVIIDQVLVVEDVYPSMEVRLDAARSAAPYYAPKLVAQQVKVIPGSAGQDLRSMTENQLDEQIANMQAILFLTTQK